MSLGVNEGASLVVLVIALTPALACVWAGTQHVMDPDAFATAVKQPHFLRRTLTRAGARAAGRAWGVLEFTAGMAAAVALVLPLSGGARVAALLWLSLMYVVFALWLMMLWRRVPAATCGCSSRDEPADGLAFLRVALLGGCAVVALLLLLTKQSPVEPTYSWVSMPMAVTIALLTWLLPAALRVSEGGQ